MLHAAEGARKGARHTGQRRPCTKRKCRRASLPTAPRRAHLRATSSVKKLTTGQPQMMATGPPYLQGVAPNNIGNLSGWLPLQQSPMHHPTLRMAALRPLT